jgi:4a-hydroxytetrahydrobiopterin dehydratase
MEDTAVSAEDFAALPGLDDWRYAVGALHARFLFPSMSAAAGFLAEVTAAGDQLDHHADIDLRAPGHVRLALTSPSAGGVTVLDAELARVVSGIAARAGAEPAPLVTQVLEIAIDTLDASRIAPFWAAVLGYRDDDGILVDPLRIGPPMWFQQMTEPRTERQRFHLDVSVPHDVAEARVAAALAAGGRLVTDRFARSWWVLADADGNEACICTWQDR